MYPIFELFSKMIFATFMFAYLISVAKQIVSNHYKNYCTVPDFSDAVIPNKDALYAFLCGIISIISCWFSFKNIGGLFQDTSANILSAIAASFFSALVFFSFLFFTFFCFKTIFFKKIETKKIKKSITHTKRKTPLR